MFHRQIETLESGINTSGSMTSRRRISVLHDVFFELGTDADNSQKVKVSTPKTKKDTPAAESSSKRRKRAKGKLIHLDDLIPEKDVKGGQQILFGVSDTTQTNNPKSK